MRIFLAVMVLLILILLIPVRVVFYTKPETTAKLKYLLLEKQLYPSAKKKKAEAPKKEKVEKEKKPEKKGFPLSAKETVSLLPKAFSRLITPVKKLLRRTTIADFSLEMTVAGDDAAETAIKFGKANAVVVNGIALLDRIFTLRAKRIDIIPGFESGENSFEISGEVRAVPLAVLIAAVSLAANLLILLLPVMMSKKRNKNADIKDVDRKEETYGQEKSAQRSA